MKQLMETIELIIASMSIASHMFPRSLAHRSFLFVLDHDCATLAFSWISMFWIDPFQTSTRLTYAPLIL